VSEKISWVDVISKGTHERFVINRARFSEKLKQKTQTPKK